MDDSVYAYQKKVQATSCYNSYNKSKITKLQVTLHSDTIKKHNSSGLKNEQLNRNSDCKLFLKEKSKSIQLKSVV